jgi:hypothetical protein
MVYNPPPLGPPPSYPLLHSRRGGFLDESACRVNKTILIGCAQRRWSTCQGTQRRRTQPRCPVAPLPPPVLTAFRALSSSRSQKRRSHPSRRNFWFAAYLDILAYMRPSGEFASETRKREILTSSPKPGPMTRRTGLQQESEYGQHVRPKLRDNRSTTISSNPGPGGEQGRVRSPQIALLGSPSPVQRYPIS